MSRRHEMSHCAPDRWLVHATVLLVAAVLAAVPAGQVRAQSVSIPASVGTSSRRVCVNAEVNGKVALSQDCLSQQLSPAPAAPGSAGNTAEGLATAPSNRVGTFNYSAESIRFGANWGKSVEPQRPPAVPVVPLH